MKDSGVMLYRGMFRECCSMSSRFLKQRTSNRLLNLSVSMDKILYFTEFV